MTRDDNKGIIAIVYNHLNLPTSISFGTKGNITYIYNANGQKLRKDVVDQSRGGSIPSITYYSNGFQYIFRENFIDYDTKLQFFPTAEGNVKNTAGVYSYIYNYTDHLGNVRLSYGLNTSNVLTILEENHYYPFGLKQYGYNGVNNQPSYKYKYNGKELQDELGLNVTAMDYRQYDNALGRFNSIDALSEMSFSTSPFAFARNNPVFWMDPSGLLSQEFINSIWNNSANNSSTTWTNDGAGNFDKQDGSGFVNREDKYQENPELLTEVSIYKGHGDSRNNDIIRGHVYWTGKYYQGWRTRQRINKFSDLGQGLQDIGDGISVVGYGLTATGIFAEIGVPLAGIGNGISLGGTVISTAAATAQVINGNDVSQNKFKIAKAFAVYGAGKVAERYINKVPGLEPTLKNVDGEEVMNLGNKILQQNISLKIMGIDRYIDAKTDEK